MSYLMKKKIKIWFTDFWPQFVIDDNYFLDIISQKYDPVLDEHNPDFLMYSCFGQKFRSYNCMKIFYTGENLRPNFNECDWAFSFDLINHPRHYRLPVYIQFGDPYRLIEPQPSPEEILAQKEIFCNFIYSNAGPRGRIDFFHKLSKYKKVHSGGRLLNNIGGRVENKVDFLRKSKFTIAYENESYPGYTTEKIFEPMLANSIPIYWGNPHVDLDFNTESFLNANDFDSDTELIEKIIELDNNDDKYLELLTKPWYKNNEVSEYVNRDKVLAQFEKIFNSADEIVPISQSTFAASDVALYKNLNQTAYDIKYILQVNKKRIENLNTQKFLIKISKSLEKFTSK